MQKRNLKYLLITLAICLSMGFTARFFMVDDEYSWIIMISAALLSFILSHFITVFLIRGSKKRVLLRRYLLIGLVAAAAVTYYMAWSRIVCSITEKGKEDDITIITKRNIYTGTKLSDTTDPFVNELNNNRQYCLVCETKQTFDPYEIWTRDSVNSSRDKLLIAYLILVVLVTVLLVHMIEEVLFPKEFLIGRKMSIFLASSSELENDRREFEIFIGRQNKLLNRKGLFLELIIWEDFIDAMSQTRLQDEYNKSVIDCDIFVSLFFTKVGKFTREEFEKAFGEFRNTGKPLIYTYFKQVLINIEVADADNNSRLEFEEQLKILGHYRTVYTDINDLKLQFKMQLDKLLQEQV